MSNLRRVIQQRNNLTDEDSDRVERVLRDYSRGQVSEREATHQLRGLVPEEAGIGLDDLLPLLLLLVRGRQGGTDIGDILNNLLGGRQSNTRYGDRDLRDVLGDWLQTPRQASSRDIDLRDLVGNILGGGQSQQQEGGLLGMLDNLIGGQAAQEQKAERSRKKNHNLRKKG